VSNYTFVGTMETYSLLHTLGIPMVIICAPLLVDLFLHLYEAEFVQERLRKREKKLELQQLLY